MALRKWMLTNILNQSDSISSTVSSVSSANIQDQYRWLGINKDWLSFLQLSDAEVIRLKRVTDQVNRQRRTDTVYPLPEHVHRWSELCSPTQVRIVIVGQDPYHNGSANGVAFGTFPEYPAPPSLQNIYKELERSIPNFKKPSSGCLDSWCTEGVLLLNTIFTVLRGRPGSHKELGWEILFQRIIKRLSSDRSNLVFMLWGVQAQECLYLIDASKHLILTSAHPSPRVLNSKKPFLGNNHFHLANEYLLSHGNKEVNWSLTHKWDD